jgi:hypothetical protein
VRRQRSVVETEAEITKEATVIDFRVMQHNLFDQEMTVYVGDIEYFKRLGREFATFTQEELYYASHAENSQRALERIYTERLGRRAASFHPAGKTSPNCAEGSGHGR